MQKATAHETDGTPDRKLRRPTTHETEKASPLGLLTIFLRVHMTDGLRDRHICFSLCVPLCFRSFGMSVSLPVIFAEFVTFLHF